MTNEETQPVPQELVYMADVVAEIAKNNYRNGISILKNGLIENYSLNHDIETRQFVRILQSLVAVVENKIDESDVQLGRIPNIQKTENLKCNFCGKTQSENVTLIAGAESYICNGCVRICNEILEKRIESNDSV